MSATHKATWPLLGLLAFLGVTSAFPAYEDTDFQELKAILEHAKVGMGLWTQIQGYNCT